MEQNNTTHPRRKAREATMQALYALEINNGFPQDVLELCDDSFNNSENDIYTRELFNCVVEKKSWADDLIRASSSEIKESNKRGSSQLKLGLTFDFDLRSTTFF